MSENTRVTKAAGVVGASTLLSRIFGFIRDVVIAWFFGAGLSSDAFFVAFRIPNLLRRLFAEGSLSIAFLPVFTECLTNQGKNEAFKLARSAIRLLSVILVITVIIGIFLSPIIIRIIAPGFTVSPEKFSLTVTLTRIMFPYIFFIGLVAICMSILNALGHFAAPALAPVFLNFAMICAVLFISPHMAEPVTGLAIGVLIGGFLQLALQLPFLMKKGFYFWEKTKTYHPMLKKVGLLMLPTVFGAAVYQINILIGTLLASLLPEGSVSYLYYADRLVQFPLGIFAIATATAVLPSLSRQASAQDYDSLRDTFAYAMRLILFITIPSMVGLIVLREPIVELLFKRGAFDAETTRLTASALLYYGIGLWAFSAVRIVVSTFYALQDTKTPVKMAAISVVANIIFSIILMQYLGYRGLALATSLASMLNFWLLARALKAKLGLLGWKSINESACKTMAGSFIMGAVVWAIALLIIPSEDKTLIGLFFGLMGSIFAGLVFYGSFSFFIRSPELEQVLAVVKRSMRIK
ncbi:MAG: murein biosynthesis integral membrane protein MurJ [Deltaproteobacteria bacterium]|jgi:putative peptidoglycan lipid II flippase|nr:murein biosynthesis integral membrane protein MurJ [Desulfobacterales bacterium]MDL1985653.1 murein biosynthesis integral membrane protein MurJ [Deltaproteobacteria bacterium]